ncbi:class I SAM-dependent methyltransferase [Pseudonocardia sp.]|uniref:class I SAM-dependent methyltransferase n=1 Tax=Pseudonocardia sp. TaxID=60912 RepID=UPI0026205E1C|nr:class I SAM-dependent methyltransferase [Pseudonocardia sp.]
MDIDPSNVAAAQGWDGPTGDFWTDNADLFDAGVARYRSAFLAAAALEPDARVLDVGCGAGQTSRDAARLAPAGHVTGIDLSARLLDLARRRAEREGLTNITFTHGDAQIADLGTGCHERVISRTGVMFFGDPVAAFANLARSLTPDGRLVAAVWQPYAEQEWVSALRRAVGAGPLDGVGPFSLGDPDRVREVLTAAGFGPPDLPGVREPMCLGPDLATAERMALGIVGGLLDELAGPARDQAMTDLRAVLAAHLGPDGVTFDSAMWIVTAAPAGR